MPPLLSRRSVRIGPECGKLQEPLDLNICMQLRGINRGPGPFPLAHNASPEPNQSLVRCLNHGTRSSCAHLGNSSLQKQEPGKYLQDSTWSSQFCPCLIEEDAPSRENASLTFHSFPLALQLRKPMVEKLRRDRINNSIEQLKQLLEKEFQRNQPSSKLEKADVLEMTVSYLKYSQSKS